MSFTPGPWQACSCGHCGLVWSLPGDYCVADALGADSDMAEQEPLPKETRVANARLISAAPDLLAALEEQVAEFDKRLREYVNGGDDDVAAIALAHHGPRMDRARAAIAKAGGK